ncbi:RNase A-like domain-containing protein [Pantoea sp. BAV 3049]|uniref:RNase A-like domain-containing protein n=1 Tax=Pantoea sp. BAV 3049 TaxID=2654188 RepID=UPI00131E814C|nr:RNase A-like domain-containing protein [Pantoea sp. BAV 3049]
MDNGIQIAMSPVQLAAVLSDKTVTESETMSNRLLGGLDLIMGSLEMAGATALCMAPEPTGLTKAACVVVGAHSMDSINTAADRMLSGTNTRTATYRAAAELAKQFGADDKTAWEIGLTVDIAVPVGFAMAASAARVAMIRSGRINLREHESFNGLKPGGHAIERHVGRTEAELRQRLASRPTMTGSSTFHNLRVAEDAISRALKFNAQLVKRWASNGRSGSRMEIDFFAGNEIGFGIKTATGPVIKSYKLRLVLVLQNYHGKPYYVLTAFPKLD